MHRSRVLNCLVLFIFIWSICCQFLVGPVEAAAAYKDIANHWARNDIEFAVGQGIVAGYGDKTFRPDKNVTRAEYMAMINRTFKLTASIPNTYSDVKSSDWFASDIGKARAAGYISGYPDGTIRPNLSISRQEAAAMIARVLGMNSGGQQATLSKYKDKQYIASWSRDAVVAVIDRGYMGGYPDNTFRPTSFIKRAEAVVILRAAYGSTPVSTGQTTNVTPTNSGSTSYNRAGTYGPGQGQDIITGDVVIGVDGVTLRNTIVKGSILVSRAVGDGTVTLTNVNITGTLDIEGGGAHSVLLNGCTVPDIVVNKSGVRVVASGTTIVNRVSLESEAVLVESGLSGTGFEKVSVSRLTSSGADIELSGSFDSVTVSARVDIAIDNGSRVSILTLDAGANVTGSGTIGTAYVNVSGVAIAQTPSSTVVAASISASVGGKTVWGANSADQTAPSFSSGYPKTSNVNTTYLDLLVKTDDSGYAYYVVLANGAKVPTSTQVKAGQDGYGSTVSSSRYGSISLSSNYEASVRISSLSNGTAYDIFVVAEDNASNLQSYPVIVDVTPGLNDTIAPDFVSGYPVKSEVTATTCNFQVKTTEDGIAYYVAVPYGAIVPTAARIKAGQNGYGTMVDYNLRGSVTLTANTLATASITGLSSSTSYDIWVVAEDKVPNLQTVSSRLDVTTLAGTSPGTLAFSAATATVAENGGTLSLTVIRSGGSTGAASVFYTSANGTAVSGSDYTLTSGTLSWVNGDAAAKKITIPILSDSSVEGAETFTVTLSGAVGATLGTPGTVTITINDAATYVLTVQANLSAGGTVTGTGNYAGGASVPVTATPAAGYTFINWTVGGTAVNTNTSFTYTMPVQNTTMLANFAPITQYALTVQANLSAGGTVTGTGNYAAGASVPVSASPAAGYTFINWTVGGTAVNSNASFTYTMPAQSTTLLASFAPITQYALTVQANPSAGGTVTGTGNYAGGASVPVSASPASGYTFVNWTVGGTAVNTNASFTYTMPAENTTLVANFALIQYVLTVLADPAAGGSVSIGGGNYPAGASVQVIASPIGAYTFKNWTVNGTEVSTGVDLTYIMPAQNTTLVANFATTP